jgi:hypothetical protein
MARFTKYMLSARHGHIESRRERRGCVMYVEDPHRIGWPDKGNMMHIYWRGFRTPFAGTNEIRDAPSTRKSIPEFGISHNIL